MSKRITKYLLITTIILLIIFLLQKINWLPAFSHVFRSEPVVIDNTPVLIKEINNLARVITISMYDEIVMASFKPKNLPSFPGLRPVPDKIVLIAKGQVLAGVDLKKLKPANIFAAADSVSLLLPPAEIFSTIVNPTGFETFDETGSWSEPEITDLKKRMRDRITARALQNQILPKALQRCKMVLENFLKSIGYKKVYFQ